MKYKIRIILQARCSSKRFPYKSIYPIHNIPLAIFCAKRLQINNNYDLILATSKNNKDNYLIKLAKKFGIKYFKGSEKNVLKRFLDASKDLQGNDVIIRATADNPLPDGNFLGEVIKTYKDMNLNYFHTDPKYFGLPHGLSLEIINVNLLRKQKFTKKNIEHVTYSLKNKLDLKKIKKKFLIKNLSNLNFSIDHVEDYIKIKEKMERFSIYTNWKKIIVNEK